MSKAKLFLYAFFLVLPLTIHCQTNPQKIDSINKLINKSYFEGNFNKEEMLKYTEDLYSISKEANFTEGQLDSIIEEARIYYMYGNYDECLARISEGIDLASSQNDYNVLCRLLLIYQSLLVSLNYINESRPILAKCEKYNNLVENKNNQRVNNIYILLAKADLLTNGKGLRDDMSLVLSYKKKAYSEALKINDSDKYKKFTVIYSLGSLAWSTALSKNFNEARMYTSKMDDLLKTYSNDDLICQNLIIKGAIENLSKNYPLAVEYLSQAIVITKQNKKVSKLQVVYPMISASYTDLKDYYNATQYSWDFKKLIDSLNTEKLTSNNLKFIDQINLKISEYEDHSIHNTKVGLIVLAVIIFLSGLYLAYNYKRYFVKNISENTEQEKSNIDNSLNLPNDKLELTRKLISLAKIDINAFYIEFTKIYPGFHQSLKDKYPELNISDLKFCSLMKMNFEIKQIAVFTNSSIRSVESRRYRIIKKMELKSQSELYLILSKLS